MLSRGKAMIFWLANALLLFGVGTSTWRDLVSSPAGTIVHVLVKGNELVPSLRTLGMLTILLSLVSLFANRLVILLLTSLTALFAIFVSVSTFGKLGAGAAQPGVISKYFLLPEAGALVGILSVLALAVAIQMSVRSWSIARYRAGEKLREDAPIDLWRAQDAGIDPTVQE